jgi:polar amino acid transport system substrate-binding protein
MKLRKTLPVVAAVAALALVGCTNTESGAPDATPSEGTHRTWAEIQESGVLQVGTIVDYPPNEYKTDDGQPTGWAVELVSAIADELGVEVEWTILNFDGILPRIQEGSIDLGVGSFTDTVERQQVVDFVNYYEAGTLWAAPVGSGIDPDDACGFSVAVMAGGTQYLDELPRRSEECVAAGKPAIEIMSFDGQPQVTNAVIQGQADAFSADSPITVDAVSVLDGKLEVIGEMFDSAPYGFPVARGSDLAPEVQRALQTLIDNGTYLKILKAGNSEMGAIEQASINAGAE